MRDGRPPRLATFLLRRALPLHHRAQVLGDVREGFALRVARRGRVRARLWYWRQLFSTDLLLLRREARTSDLRHPPRPENTPMILDGLRSDVAYALRGLRQSPLFTLTAVATVALGIGVSTVMFTAFNAVLLRPLPYPDADDLVMVFRTVPRFDLARSVASYPDFLDWRERSTSLADMAAYGYVEAVWLGDDSAEKWSGRRITANLFPLLGIAPALGRGFTAVEDRPDGPPAIILSDALWRSRFGADAGVLGRTLRFADEDRTIVGVMPAGVAFPGGETVFWTPLRGDATRMERDTNFLQVIGRLAARATVTDAQRDLESLAAAIDASAPGANDGYGIFVESHREFVVGGARQLLWMLAGAVALVLVIACVNVADLMLVRAAGRDGELSLRMALGADRGRLFRLLLTESALLAGSGGLLGIAAASILLPAMLRLGGGALPRSADIRLDGAALGFSLVLASACALVFGAAPAWLRSRHPRRFAAVSGTTSPTPAALRVQRALVSLQVALAVTLVLGASLLATSFLRLADVDLGFDPNGVVAGRIALPNDAPMEIEAASEEDMAALARDRVARRDLFVDTLLAEAGRSEQVEMIGVSYNLPLGRSSFSRTMIPAGAEATEEESPAIPGNVVAGDYFRAMGIRLLAGRTFDAGDRFDASPVILVNESLAAAFWPQREAVGQRVRIGDADNPWVTVIGVVADVRGTSLAAAPRPRYYRPLSQVAWPDALFVVVRTNASTEDAVAELRRAVARLDGRLPLTDVTTTAGLVAADLAAPRFRTLLLTFFGASATALALIGTYGMVSFVVAGRRRELGVRRAIGARGADLVRSVLMRELRPVMLGVLVGLAGAAAGARLIAGFLYGIGPFHPGIYAAVAAAVIAVVGAACYLPARRAAAAPPNDVLRTL